MQPDRHKDFDTAQAAIRSQELIDAGIHYLQHEPFSFTTASGRLWNVYGSPVSHNVEFVIGVC